MREALEVTAWFGGVVVVASFITWFVTVWFGGDDDE